MADTRAPESAAAVPKGLIVRVVGVFLSPRATYADVAARPRWFGALAVGIVIIAAMSIGFFSTEVGKGALLDQQLRAVDALKAYGLNVPPEARQRIEESLSSPWVPYRTAAGQIVFVPIVVVILAGILMGIFAVLGGDATFKQVLSIVTHSGLITAGQQLFVMPLNYVRESLTSPTNLGVFLPFLDENTFAARLFGSIDLFLIWWIANLAIGLGVLYKRRTGPVSVGMLTTYLVIVLVIAAIRTALAGA